MLKILLALVVIAMPASDAVAAKRVALVIGNDAYSEVTPLEKATQDALAVSAKVTEQGFAVTTLIDGSRRQIAEAFTTYTSQLQPGDTALLFFAGHGVEIDGENYLLPVDIAVPSSGAEDFIKFESFALSDLLDRIRRTGARTTLVFLDACRDNPFASGTAGRSIGRSRGLGRIAAPEGTFVVYSAGAGQQALDSLAGDDPDANSVFTRLLLPKLSAPGLELRRLIAELRVEVRDLARTQSHAQFPAYYDELLGEFFFAGRAAAAAADTPVMERTSQQDRIRQDFALTREIGTAAALKAFLDDYGESDDLTIDIAKQMLAELIETTQQTDTSETQTSRVLKPDRAQGTGAVVDRDIIRRSQSRLNELGCNAGVPDGIAGRQTRSAFTEFLTTARRADLSAADLGTPAALAALRRFTGQACKPQVRVERESSPAANAAPPTDASRFVGEWKFNAKCPLFIKSNGTIDIQATGPSTLVTNLQDNLGNSATAILTVSGLNYQGKEQWSSGLTTNTSGVLAAEGGSFTGKGGVGCSIVATRQ